MEELWTSSDPLTSAQITGALCKRTSWSDKTIKTMIFRLVKKKVISYKEEKREYHYYPLYAKSDYLKKESESFMSRIFKGSATPMISYFLKDNQFSKHELEEIQKLLNEIKSGGTHDLE